MTGPKRVTEKQLAANRANALRSTGPRTPEGRAAVRYNALTHGILAQAVIPEALEPYESREEFDALIATLRDEFAPANSVEELLVEQIAVAYWRLSRLYRAEAGAIAARHEASNRPNPLSDLLSDLERQTMGPMSLGDLKTQVEQPRSAISDGRDLRVLLIRHGQDLRQASNEALRETAERLLADLEDRLAMEEHHRRAIANAEQSLPHIEQALKFARYESALQNQLDRALPH